MESAVAVQTNGVAWLFLCSVYCSILRMSSFTLENEPRLMARCEIKLSQNLPG